MQKAQAQDIVRETLQNDFDKERFLYFVKNLLNKVDDSKAFHAHGYVPEAYKTFIKTYERLATYTDPTGSKIDILVVYLQKETSLERARTAQRNFVARYLKDRDQKDAGLIAFVSPDPADWRFSLVKMEYKFTEGKSGKTKIKEEFTPAKRWSFLVGKNENSHTAQSRLAPIVEDDQANPTLKQLEDAFNIEKVTKEFFEKYRELFLRVYETLTDVIRKHPDIKTNFTEKNVNTVDFSKKLLGQIVFLYFLQKKGWFGVPMNKGWGNGDKKFLRTLFEEATGKNKNYFDDYLEPLFYEALAKERDDDFYSRFECKVPFLNGGLFDPISNYDWVNTAIDLPNDIFSNTRKTKDGDIGDGILDIFDRCNFTVKEDEPLEKEVAVDPEMLGKVFENLLEVKDRKSKGTYYTPREIVHYMCEQSLVNYLTANHSNISKEKVKEYLYYADNINNLGKIKIKGESFTPGQYQELDELLKTIKVIDPACGSGAFLITMLQEIVKLRRFLQLSPDNIKNGALVEDQSPYELKRQTIENNIYGVDIDPSAVEIAKLRLWLSLVVDEDNIKQIKPLPNLDYKIMQGNSLLEEFEGIKLFDEKLLQSPIITADLLDPVNELISKLQNQLLKYYSQHPEWMQKGEHRDKPQEVINLEKRLKDVMRQNKKIKENSTEQKDLFSSPYNESLYIREQLENLHKEFFKETNKSRKDDLKRRINNLEWDLIEVTLKEQNKLSTLKKLEEFKLSNTKPFFLWKLNFADVFEDKGGFDVVVANPPYLKERDNKKVFKEVNESAFGKRWHQGKMDYWFYFLHRAIDIAKSQGTICYITSRYWINSHGAEKLIGRIRDELSFVSFLDIGKLKVFDNVAGQHMVALYQKDKSLDSFTYKRVENNLSEINFDRDTENLKIKILSNSEVIGTKNEISLSADVIKYEDIKLLGDITKISQGVVQNPDKVSNSTAAKYHLNAGEGVFVLRTNELKKLNTDNNELRFIKTFFDETAIYKYKLDYKDYKFLLYLTKESCKNISEYPNIEKHLKKYKKIMLARRETISGSNKWFHLHWPRTQVYFESPKIVQPAMFDKPHAAYVEDSAYFGLSTNVIIQKDRDFNLLYSLAILNSTFASYWFKNHGKRRGVGVDIGVEKLRQFPIKNALAKEQKPFIDFVEKILKITKTDNYLKNTEKQAKVRDIERQIDELVYKLYGLTEEEIKIVEGVYN